MLDNGAAMVGTINTPIGNVSLLLVFRNTFAVGTRRRVCEEPPNVAKFICSVPLC